MTYILQIKEAFVQKRESSIETPATLKQHNKEV